LKKKICIAQIGFDENIKRHINKIKDIIHENRKAHLIVFPELILHGHPSVEKPEGILYRRVKYFYKSIANDSDDLYKFIRQEGARVIIGELKGKIGDFYNAATYIDKDRTVSYSKVHIHWTENFLPGKGFKVLDIPAGKVGMIICYDGAFSESWRVLALNGAEIIVNISATPKTFPDKYVWRRLQGAAISNQVYIVYANRPGDYFSGHSTVIDPMGEVLIDAGTEENILHCEIDLKLLYKWRKQERLFSERRPVLYRDVTKRMVV